MRAGHLRNASQPLRASVFLLGKSGKVVLTIQGDECMSSTQHPARLLVDVQYMVASENSFFAAHGEVGKAKCSESPSLTTRINAIPAGFHSFVSGILAKHLSYATYSVKGWGPTGEKDKGPPLQEHESFSPNSEDRLKEERMY